VPAENPAALATVLQSYVDDKTKQQKQGHAGRARVEKQFSIENMVNEYLTVYSDLLAAKH